MTIKKCNVRSTRHGFFVDYAVFGSLGLVVRARYLVSHEPRQLKEAKNRWINLRRAVPQAQSSVL